MSSSLLDRSDSIPSPQQEAAQELRQPKRPSKRRRWTKPASLCSAAKPASRSSPNAAVDLQKIQAVVGTERTDIAAAIRLGTAAFPETGQKRLVLLSDGNENVGDAMGAVLAAKPLGVTVDVVPHGRHARQRCLGAESCRCRPSSKRARRSRSKSLSRPTRPQPATMRLYRNEQFLGEQKVELSAGKNLFTFPQTLPEPGFYNYDVQVDAPGDPLPQNNRATGFATVRGEPRILIVSADPEQDRQLAAALQSRAAGSQARRA